MAAFKSAFVILACLWEVCSCNSSQETHRTTRKNAKTKSRQFEPCVFSNSCPISNEYIKVFKSENKTSNKCHSDADCPAGESCHTFHRLCFKPQEIVTVAPMKTFVKRKCSKTSECRKKEYCHDFWKICLPSIRVYQQPLTKRPSGYCRTSKDCKIDEQCHRIFHACYTSPTGMSAVRRDAGNPRRCNQNSDCSANFYCHDHFRICLENRPIVLKSVPKTADQISCDLKTPCPKGMLCHDFWKKCYTPARNVTFPEKTGNKTQQCSDDADCGPNKCCLENLGICMAYKLPGEMCLVAKTDSVCSCAIGSYCKPKEKWVSPRRIINKMGLPQTAAGHLMIASNRKKYKVGKCTPSAL